MGAEGRADMKPFPRYWAETDRRRCAAARCRAELLRLLAAALTGAAVALLLWTCSVHRKQVLHVLTFHRHNQTLIIATP